MRNITMRLASLVLCLSLALGMPATALARTDSGDYIGSQTVSERALTVIQVPDVACTTGLLVDANGNVLWSRGASTTGAMASITKVMTAIIILEDPNMTPSTMVTIGHDAATTGGQVVGLVEGTQVSVDDLMKGLLVHSGNDCAVALADACTGSTDSFVALMNERASKLGMTNTHFDNVNGLDEGDTNHYSTPEDIMVMCRYAMQYSEFREIVAMTECTVSNGNERKSFESTNLLFGMMDGVIGIKTGYTALAGNCLASAAQQEGTELYCVVLGCETEEGRFTDSKTLYEWAFKHYRPTVLAAAGTDAAAVPCVDWMDKTVTVEVPRDVLVNILDYDGPVDQVINLKEAKGSIKKGQVLGSVQWIQNEKIIASSDLVAAADQPAPSWFESFSIMLRRGWASIFGGDKVATGDTYLPPVTIPAVTEA